MATAIAPAELVGELGTVLGVWAHPDDEAYLSGALMAAATDAGQRVVLVTATRGEAGFPDLDRPVEERRSIRERELAACLEILGVTEHRWLDEADGACDRVDPDAPVATLCEVLEDVRPDTVLTFGPDGMTGHGDHIAVGWWTTLACRRVAHRGTRLLYATKTPEWNETFFRVVDPGHVMMIDGYQPPATPVDRLAVWCRPEPALLERKIRALHAQESQVGPLAAVAGEEGFRDLAGDEFFRAPTAADWPD